MKRETLDDEPGDGGLYFAADPKAEYFGSGCTILNCVLSGRPRDGWRENRIINLVGDSSTGKTLLAIEAAANYRRKYPDAPIIYLEVESAFDLAYAQYVGLPKTGVTFPNQKELVISSVEDWERHLEKIIEKGKRALYILDSLDALSDEAELGRDVGEATYGASKAKQMSTMFRRINSKLAAANVTVLIVSQTRDAIGVTFGNKKKRSGGQALTFYASQVLWLHHIGRLMRTYKGVKRAYGVQIKAQAEKSKVGLPFRTVDFPIYFTYGVEDVVACVEWLIEVKQIKRAFRGEDDAKKWLEKLDTHPIEEYRAKHKELRVAVGGAWTDIEKGFVTTRRKYA